MDKHVDVRPGDKFSVKSKDGILTIDGIDDTSLIDLAIAVDLFLEARKLDDHAMDVSIASLHSRMKALPYRVQSQIGHSMGVRL